MWIILFISAMLLISSLATGSLAYLIGSQLNSIALNLRQQTAARTLGSIAKFICLVAIFLFLAGAAMYEFLLIFPCIGEIL